MPEELDDELEESRLTIGEALAKVAEHVKPQPYWNSKSLVLRLRGIYAVGPDAMNMGPHDSPEFGWRVFDKLPGIQSEAAHRIETLERELQELRVRFFEQECRLKGI